MSIQQPNESQYLLLFDLDGTLLDTAKQIEFSMNQIRIDFGYGVLMPAEYVRLIGQPVDQLLLDLNLSFEEKEQVINQFRIHLRTEITRNGVECFDGVIDIFYLLESLGVSVAVATTKPSELAKHTVNHSKLRQFNIHIQGTDNFPPKPSPIVINKILTEFNPMCALMVGDRIEDIEAASRAGISSIGIAAGAHKEKALLSSGAKLAFPDFLGFSRFASLDPEGFRGYFSNLNLT